MAKTTLTVEIQYDARLTDPEGLASAMDRLLETALSTPGIMQEYGDPKMGEFFVAPSASNPSASQVLVVAEISGGTLQEVYASDPAVRTVLVDWDNDGCEPGQDMGIIEVTNDSGRSQMAFVCEVPVLPIADMQDRDAGRAIEAAGIEHDNGAQQAQQEQSRQIYTLRIDGPLLRKQRMALFDVSRLKLTEEARESLEGLTALLDEISDQAHDKHGIDSLLASETDEDPGDHNQHRRASITTGQKI